MDAEIAQAIMQAVSNVEIELYFMLFKACLVLFLTLILGNTIRNFATYMRLRFSDLFSKRTVIEYDGFRGVIEEISMNGIFIKNVDGVTKFVPLNRWHMGDIRYPNTLDTGERHE